VHPGLGRDRLLPNTVGPGITLTGSSNLTSRPFLFQYSITPSLHWFLDGLDHSRAETKARSSRRAASPLGRKPGRGSLLFTKKSCIEDFAGVQDYTETSVDIHALTLVFSCCLRPSASSTCSTGVEADTRFSISQRLCRTKRVAFRLFPSLSPLIQHP
jgi:hypothetical protein